MHGLFRVRMALRTVPALLPRASEAFAPPVDEAREFMPWHEGVRTVGETTWYQRGAGGSNEDGRKALAWVAAQAGVCVAGLGFQRQQICDTPRRWRRFECVTSRRACRLVRCASYILSQRGTVSTV